LGAVGMVGPVAGALSAIREGLSSLFASSSGLGASVGAGAGEVGGMCGAEETAVRIPDSHAVVRGGQTPMPPQGELFSGSHGSTLESAASGVPHGTIRSTTAGEIRQLGGRVDYAPEMTRSGTMNYRHVDVTEGCLGPSCFSSPFPNPVPPASRIR